MICIIEKLGIFPAWGQTLMKLYLTILSFLTFKVASSQVTPQLLLSKAYDYTYTDKKLDSALKCYQELRTSFPEYKKASILYKIANTLLKIGDTAQAESLFLESIHVDFQNDTLDFDFGQAYSCAKLADIYYKQKKYSKAIIYLDYTKKEFKPLQPICEGGYGQTNKLEFQYKKAICYYGLNKKDSSIINLAPYIFKANDYYDLDSLKYNAISNFFVSTLFEYYGKCEAKTEMAKAINNIYYLQTFKEERDRKIKWLYIDCSINYFGFKIHLDNGSKYVWTQNRPIPDYLSKDFLFKEFTKSPAFKTIMK